MSTFALNSGTYFGNGYAGSAGYRNDLLSSTKCNRVSRDMSYGYSSDINTVKNYLAMGKVDKAITLYKELLNDMSPSVTAYGYQTSDGQLASVLSDAYASVAGEDFGTALIENTHSSFVNGFIEGIPVIGWFLNSTSTEEAMAKVGGTTPELKDKIIEGIGAAAGGIAGGAAAGAAIGALGGPIGAVGGAVIGGIVGVVRTIVLP